MVALKFGDLSLICIYLLQAHGLSEEALAKREVVKIDIGHDPVERRVSCYFTNLFIICS